MQLKGLTINSKSGRSRWTKIILCICQLTTLLRTDWIEIADQLNCFPKEQMYYHRGTYLRTCRVVEAKIQRQRFRRTMKEPVPWVMWWSRLPGDDKLNGVPTALAVLHQDRYWILPTRQGAGQGLAWSHRLHTFHTTGPKRSAHGFNCPLVDSKSDRVNPVH